MTRRYTAAEARELVEASGHLASTPYRIDPRDPRSILRADGDRVAVLEGPAWDTDGPLFAAAPDLAESLAAVEAERDALRSLVREYLAAFDRWATALDNGHAGSRLGIGRAVDDAVDALREAAE